MASRWLDPVWAAVDTVGVARRSAIDVGHYVGEAQLLEEARSRGLHVLLVEEAQYLVLRGTIELKC
jgi:hypothetical protein